MTMLTVRDGVESLKERFSGLASGTGPALAIFVIALCLRFLFLWDVGDSPYYETLILDAQEYTYLADQLLKGDWRLDDKQTYVHGLLYPLVLAFLKLCGLGFGAIQLFQAFVGALSCVLIYRIAAQLFQNPVPPLLAGLLAAWYWPFIFFNGELMATTQFIFLELWLAFALLRYGEGPSLRRILECALLLGLLAATRANSLLLLPIIAWWIHSTTLPGGKSKRTQWLAFGAMLTLTLAPIAIRNQLASGGPLPFQGGWSFYMGTNSAADGTPYVRQGVQWQRHELLPLQAGVVEPHAKGVYYTAAGLRYIADQPADYIHLLYRKFRLFWHAFEIPVSTDLRYYQQHSSLNRVLPLNFGVLIPIAIAGLPFVGRRRPSYLIGGFVLTSLATGLLFTVCARYRLPAVPFLIIFAAHGIWRLVQLARERNLRAAGLFLLLLVVSFGVVHTGVDKRQVDHVRSDLLLGQVYHQTGKYGLAEHSYAAALRKNPDDSDILNSLGTLFHLQGRYEEAEVSLRTAIAVAPDHSRPRLDLAALLLSQGQLQEARQELDRVLEIDPRTVPQYEAHSAMGNLHLRSGAYGLAADSFERALEARKGTHAYYELSHARALLGQTEAQLRALEQAVEYDPGFAPALRNLGALYVQRGNYDDGERRLLQSLEYEPLSVAAHRNLGALYQRLGQQQEADLFFHRAEELLRNTP